MIIVAAVVGFFLVILLFFWILDKICDACEALWRRIRG